MDREVFLTKTVDDLREKLETILKYKPNPPVILESSTKDKTSFHLIFKDVICNGSTSAGDLLVQSGLIKLYGTSHNKDGWLDDGIYSSKRPFRLLNSCKRGKTAPFVLLSPKDTTIADTYATIWKPKEAILNYKNRPTLSTLSLYKQKEGLAYKTKSIPRGFKRGRLNNNDGLPTVDIEYIKKK